METNHENAGPDGKPVQGWKRIPKRIKLPPGSPTTTDYILAERYGEDWVDLKLASLRNVDIQELDDGASKGKE